MFSLFKYILVLVAGLGLGYWYGTSTTLPQTQDTISNVPAASLTATAMQASQPAQNTEKATAAPSDKAARAQNPLTEENTSSPQEPDPFAEITELEKASADPSWSAFLQQHYDETTQQILKFQTAYNKQQIKDFQQSEVDHHWATLTEQKLQDFYFLQPDQQFIKTTKIHCRQNGCEISGIVSKVGLLNQLQEEMRQLPWTQGRSFSFSTKSGQQGDEKFYMLLQDLPKE